MFSRKSEKTSDTVTPASGGKTTFERLRSSSEIAQSYETLLSSLYLLSPQRPLKTVLVTSTQPQEGKTTVTVNLAITMRVTGKNVLVLDGDLRKPTMHRVLKLENGRGLSDILTGSLGVQEVIQTVDIGESASAAAPTLSVITSGNGVPDFFHPKGSSKLKEAIEYLRNVYDVVLLDSPPVLSVNDSLLFAPLVDGVIFVLNAGEVAEQDAKRAIERLEQVGAHMLGVAMNRFDEKVHGPGFHPYSNYYQSPTSRKHGRNTTRTVNGNAEQQSSAPCRPTLCPSQ